MAQTPRIVRSDLTKPPRWYVVTRYRERRGRHATTGISFAYLIASVKHDVTDQMTAILRAARPRKQRKAC